MTDKDKQNIFDFQEIVEKNQEQAAKNTKILSQMFKGLTMNLDEDNDALQPMINLFGGLSDLFNNTEIIDEVSSTTDYRCENCGAPFDQGTNQCEYCGSSLIK